MSSFEFRSAVLVIHVRTLWSVYEKARPPPIWIVALALAPPVFDLALYFSVTLPKSWSKMVLPGSKAGSFSFFLSGSSATKPAVAVAVSVALRADPTPKVRKVESRIWVAVRVNPVESLSVGVNLTRAMPPLVSFSSAPSWMTCLSTRR